MRKDHVVIEIIRDRGDQRYLRRQRKRGQRSLEPARNIFSRRPAGLLQLRGVHGGDWPALEKTFHQLRHHVLTVRRTAAVAADQEFVAASISRDEQIERGGKLLLARSQDRIPFE